MPLFYGIFLEYLKSIFAQFCQSDSNKQQEKEGEGDHDCTDQYGDIAYLSYFE